MFGVRRTESGSAAPTSCALWRWFAPQRNIDTLVFVHGILGHYVRAWGKFPGLLASDPDLPDLDILLWGYRNGFLSRHNELHIEGGHLLTKLEIDVRLMDSIVLVGHSMGGLIILKGLVDRMAGGHAQKAPCHAITWITLYASPLNGAWLAGILRKMLLIPMWLTGTLHRHLHALSRGDFVEKLMAQVTSRIYRPETQDQGNRKIPIRLVAATRDRAVDRADRDLLLAPYNDPPTHQVDHGHRSVKKPKYHGDERYRVLATDLQVALQGSFRRLCAAVMSETTSEEDRWVALDEMRKRYDKMIRVRMQDLQVPAARGEDAEGEFLSLVAHFGARNENVPPYDAINRAMIVLKKRHRDWG